MSEFLREPAPGGKDNDDYNDDGDGNDGPDGKDNDDYNDDGHGDDEPGGTDDDDDHDDDNPGGTDDDDDGDHRACTWWRNSEGVTSSSWTSRRQKVVGLQPWIFSTEWIICRSL